MKKALVPSTLVTIMIILISFVALGYAVVRITGIIPSTLDREACRDSVILRSSDLLKGTHLTPELIPLKCKTENIKISSPIEEDIQKTVVNAMYDCWWMLGEGKVDFFTPSNWWNISNPLGLESPNCIICSQIKFEGGAKNKNIDIIGYMNRKIIPGKDITYMQYFNGNKDAVFSTNVEVKPLNTNTDYSVIFIGVKGVDVDKHLKNAQITGVVAGATIGAAAGSVFFGIGTVPGALVGGLIGTVVGFGSGSVVGGASVVANAYFASTYCNGANGCFNMVLVPSTAENIGKYCQKIESIP